MFVLFGFLVGLAGCVVPVLLALFVLCSLEFCVVDCVFTGCLVVWLLVLCLQVVL